MKERIAQLKLKMFKYRVKQIELAKILGIADYMLSKYLNGHIEMPEEIYQKIEKYLQKVENSQQPTCK